MTTLRLADRTARENIMTSIRFLGFKCCGTYDRHNELAQVAFAWFKREMKFSGSGRSAGRSFDSSLVGISAKGKGIRAPAESHTGFGHV